MKVKNEEILVLENPSTDIVKSIKVDEVLSMVRITVESDPDMNRIIKQSDSVLEMANVRNVTSDTELLQSGEMVSELKKMIKVIDSNVNFYVDKANKLHKGLTLYRSTLKKKILDSIEMLDGKVSNYRMKQERIREAEQAKFAEKQRKENEKREKELAEQARKHEEKGNLEKAKERLQMIDDIKNQPGIMLPDIDKRVEGENIKITFTDHITAEVTDIPMLCGAIADGQAPIACVKFLPSELVKCYKATNKTAIPGVEFKVVPKGKGY